MNQLVSMLVPLETLPGWPEAPAVSWLHALGLLVGLPLVVIIIIATIGKIGAKRSSNRGYDIDDRFQLETGPGGSGSGAVAGSSGSAAISSGPDADASLSSSAGRAEQAQGAEQAEVGGASARW